MKTQQLYLVLLSSIMLFPLFSISKSLSYPDTIYIYEEEIVYDTVYEYEAVLPRETILVENHIKKQDPDNFLVQNHNLKLNTKKTLVQTATISKNDIIPVNNQSQKDMKKFSIIAFSLASLNLSAQEIGFKTSWQKTGTEINSVIHSSNSYTPDISKESNFQYTLFGKMNLNKQIKISSGIGYSKIQGYYHNGYYYHPNYYVSNNQSEYPKLDQHYLNIPLSFQYEIIQNFNLELGIDNYFLLKESSETPWHNDIKTYDPAWYLGANINVFTYLEIGANWGSYFRPYAYAQSYYNGTTVKLKHKKTPQVYLAFKYPLFKEDRQRKNQSPKFIQNFYDRSELGINISTGLWWEASNFPEIEYIKSSLISLGTYFKTPIIKNYIDFKSGFDYAYLLPSNGDMYSISESDIEYNNELVKKMNESVSHGKHNLTIPLLLYFSKFSFSPFAGINCSGLFGDPNSNPTNHLAYVIGLEQKFGERFSANIDYRTNNQNNNEKEYHDTGEFTFIHVTNYQVRFSVNYIFKNKLKSTK